jgi:hypothetical protein
LDLLAFAKTIAERVEAEASRTGVPVAGAFGGGPRRLASFSRVSLSSSTSRPLAWAGCTSVG